MSIQKRIYLDNASTAPIDPRVLKEVVFYLRNTAGNAGSIHGEGVKAKKVLEESRKKVAGFLGGHSDEIVFTSGGTESNNLAILGSLSPSLRGRMRGGGRNPTFILPFEKGRRKPHAITSVIEHSSILECFRELEKRGAEVTYLPVDSGGIVDLSAFKKALRQETVLVSIQYANNEIGTIQPLSEIAKIIRNFRKRLISNIQYPISSAKVILPLIHTDASQAPAYLDCNVEKLGVDLLTLDGHKIYGPKGIGALYVRRGTPIAPIVFGGGQEKNLRPGTENVPLIAGLTKALEICANERQKEFSRLIKLRDYIYSSVLQNTRIDDVLNGSAVSRLPNNLNFSIKNVDTEFLTLQLDAKGIAVSTKSACLGGGDGSYVVSALGGEKWRSTHTLRITLGRFTKKSDIQYFLKVLSKILKK